MQNPSLIFLGTVIIVGAVLLSLLILTWLKSRQKQDVFHDMFAKSRIGVGHILIGSRSTSVEIRNTTDFSVTLQEVVLKRAQHSLALSLVYDMPFTQVRQAAGSINAKRLPILLPPGGVATLTHPISQAFILQDHETFQLSITAQAQVKGKSKALLYQSNPLSKSHLEAWEA